MSRSNRWLFPEHLGDFDRILQAAKEDSPQIILEDDGVYTVTFERRGPKGSSREFLTAGGPDDEI